MDGIDMLKVKTGFPSLRGADKRAGFWFNREQNILDAVSLPVNRLAFNRILSAG